jgi:hypothetical protein
MISVIDKQIFGGRVAASSRGADGFICITTYNEKTPIYVRTGATVPFTSVAYHTKQGRDEEHSCVDAMFFSVPAKWMSSSARLVNAKMERGHKIKNYPKVTVELRPITEEEAKLERENYDAVWNKIDYTLPDNEYPSLAATMERFVRVLSFSMLVPSNMLIDTTPDPKRPVVQPVVTQIAFGDKKEETKEDKKADEADVEESPTKKARKSAPARDGKEGPIADTDGEPMGHGGWKCPT